MPTHLSLFSGIGGIDLAAEWAGFRTVCFVEINKFCQKVLRKHWPDVPIVEDIHDVTKEKVMAYANSLRLEEHGLCGAGISKRSSATRASDKPKEARSDVKRGRFGAITLITGGFPCQPVSVAGKQRGKEDDRWLWPEMLRVIREVRPAWVVAENVAGLLRMGLNDCLSDLEGEGFEVTTFLIPACAVNAPHRRDRVFIVAHDGLWKPVELSEGEQKCGDRIDNGCQDVADTTDGGNQPRGTQGDVGRLQGKVLREGWNPDHWATEPDVGRVAHGVPSRVDRLRALGNAVVPQQIYPILKAIAEIEKE